MSFLSARQPARAVAVLLIGAALAVMACGGAGEPQATSASLVASKPWLGMVSEDAFVARGTAREEILAAQRRTGVQLLRQTFDWREIEQRRGRYDFRAYDDYMADTARAGIQVLPLVFGVPAFRAAKRARGAKVTPTTVQPPRRPADMAAFITVLIRRYGPRGSFWRTHPEVPRRPIEAWQVWNEPNLPAYWGGRPSAKEYVALLRTVHRAIRAADPTAQTITAGLPDSRTGIGLDRYLRQMLAAGARGTFDGLAIHPYAVTSSGVLSAVRHARRLLDGGGLRGATLWVTEFGWSSGGPRSSFTVGEKRQAALVLQTITGLAKQARALRLRSIVYYDWRDAPPYRGKGDFWGLHTGLLNRDGSAKPALSTYYQAAGVLGALPKE